MSWDRFLFCSDLHGDHADHAAVRRLLAFKQEFKPKHVIFGGDLWDFRPLRKGASSEERAESMASDFNAGMGFLKAYFPKGQASEKRYFLRGNHCERLWELAERGDGLIADHAIQGIQQIDQSLTDLHIQMLPYHKRHGILQLGHAKFLHGFHAGIHAARQSALVYGACLMGHVHTVSSYSIPGLESRTARAVGCLCSLDLDYMARTPSSLAQRHGWAYGVINSKTGDYFSHQAECINGEWNIDLIT